MEIVSKDTHSEFVQFGLVSCQSGLGFVEEEPLFECFLHSVIVVDQSVSQRWLWIAL